MWRVGQMVLDENGEILYVRWAEIEELDEEGRGRFESRFVEIPYFFEKGCQVRDVLSGKYGILAWHFNEQKAMWEKLRRQRKRLYYFHGNVEVMFLGKDGSWSATGISPLRLEAKAMSAPLSDVVGYSHACALQAFSDYWSKGRVNADAVLRYCMEYAESCRINSYITRREEDTFYAPKTVEDIMDTDFILMARKRKRD